MSLARRLGIIYLLLATHAALEGVMLINGALRFIPEQLLFNILGQLTKDPEGTLLAVHLAGLVSLASMLRLWFIQHRYTRLAMAVTAIVHAFLAPFGLIVTAAVLWLLRNPDFDVETPIAPIAGQSRSIMVLQWTVASFATWVLCLPVLFLFGTNVLVWFVAVLASAAPQVGLGWWLMHRPARQDAITGMPELPDIRA